MGTGPSLEYPPDRAIGTYSIWWLAGSHDELHGKLWSDPTGPQGSPKGKALGETIPESVGFQEILNRFLPGGCPWPIYETVGYPKPFSNGGSARFAGARRVRGRIPAVFDVEFSERTEKPIRSVAIRLELLEKLYEIGMVLLVEYDKPGIYLISAGSSRYLDRVGVSTGFSIDLAKSYLMIIFKRW